jgi:hypothetical protein
MPGMTEQPRRSFTPPWEIEDNGAWRPHASPFWTMLSLEISDI